MTSPAPTTPDYPPLTAATLQEFVKDQQEIESGIADDCAALEDMLVRLAGPALQGVEDDTAAIEDVQERLAAPIVAGTRKDTAQLLRMGKKLVAPIDQGIAEDTTLLTGMLARARSSPFPVDAIRPGLRGSYPPVRGVGTHEPHHAPRPPSTPTSPARVGLPGISLADPAIGRIGPATARSAQLPPVPPLGFAETESVRLVSPGGNGAPLTPAALSPLPTPPAQPPSPFAAPHPPAFGAVVGSEQGAAPVASPGALVGGAVALGRVGDGAAPVAIPAPPPPLPYPPADTTDLCACVLHLADTVGGQLMAIAQALYSLRPDVQAVQQQEDLLQSQIIQRWVDPPDQDITATDLPPEEDRDAEWLAGARQFFLP